MFHYFCSGKFYNFACVVFVSFVSDPAITCILSVAVLVGYAIALHIVGGCVTLSIETVLWITFSARATVYGVSDTVLDRLRIFDSFLFCDALTIPADYINCAGGLSTSMGWPE